MNLPDPEYFNFKECVVAGDECLLITPKDITVKWSDETLKFRSLIIRKDDHMVVSCGLGKFFNLSEKPDIDKFPDGPFEAIEKKDGSCFICTWTVGKNNQEEYIFRTRGTSDVRVLDNGYELDFLLEKYPKLKVAMKLNPLYTIICEWQTPNNEIVLREVSEPTLCLIAVVSHEDFSYVSQKELDERAIAWGLDRPKRYHYNSIKECVEDVTTWKGKEGVVLYSEDGQHLRKIKSEEYLRLHGLLFGYKTIKSYLDLFMSTEKFTKYSEFYEYIETTLDHEIAERGKDFIRDICVAYSKVVDKLNNVTQVVNNVRTGFSRKEQALEFQNHWSDWRVPAAFQLLDNNEVNEKTLRKGIEHELGI